MEAVRKRMPHRRTALLYKVISTDPPYYDNIGYADLSDFFYVWLRRSLKPVFPTCSRRWPSLRPKNWSPPRTGMGTRKKQKYFFWPE